MICRKCGHANEDGVLFCEQCKEDLDTPMSTAAAVAEVNVEEPLTLPVADEQPPVAALPLGEGNEIPVLEPVSPEPVVTTYREPEPVVPTASVEPPPTPTINVTPLPIAPETVTVPAEALATPAVVEAPPAITPHPRKPKLVVIRGLRMDATYPIYDGKNYIGRTDDQPVDIDLDDQESPERIWSSRQHAIIHLIDGKLTVEDLKSLNGTFVNRARVHPGQMRELVENDVVQIGTVHMKVVFS